jgi:hypothetical protein
MKNKNNKSESDCPSPMMQAFETLLKEAFPDARVRKLFCQTLLQSCHSHLIEQTDQLERLNDGRFVNQGVDVQKDGVKTFYPINFHTFSKISEGFQKIDHGCYAIIKTLSDEGKSNTSLFKQIVRIREEVDSIGKSLNPTVFL